MKQLFKCRENHLTRYITYLYFIIDLQYLGKLIGMYVTFETKGLRCEDETLLDLIQNNFMKIQIRL